MSERSLVVASRNPIKARAVAHGYARMFPNQPFQVESLSVPSGVADQPRTDEETRRGAENRARAAAAERPDTDLCFGLEGGVYDDGADLVAMAWIVAVGRGHDGAPCLGASRTASFALPQAVATLVRAGTELGEADDIVFGRTNSKHASGAVGLLTGDAIDRAGLYEQAVVLSLIPFRAQP